jgi:hypothetical protein
MRYQWKALFLLEDAFPHSKVVYIVPLIFVEVFSHPSDASNALSP